MADQKTQPALIVRDFTDAGTGASFVKDATVSIEVGAYANYLAAGLVAEPPSHSEPAADHEHA